MSGKLTKGMVQVYTGNGKGKTTAAFGQALRAYGSGLGVAIVQFLKDGSSGEVSALKSSIPEVEVFCYGAEGFIGPSGPCPEDMQRAFDGLQKCYQILSLNKIDILVMDEICTAVSLGLLDESSVLSLLKSRPGHVEVVLTGRNATPAIIAAADLVTEMMEIKHPFAFGQAARKGIEY